MAISSGYISHSIGVSRIDIVGELFTTDTTNKISGKNVWNQFDEFGLLVATPRLSAETNSSYRRRIYDAFTHQSNSSYRGLVHAITRDLGLELYKPIIINPILDRDGNTFPIDPFVLINGPALYLYSDYRNDVLDCQIDLQETGGNYDTLGALVDFINSTTYFTAELISSDYRFVSSANLVSQSNRIEIDAAVDQSRKVYLGHPYIIRGSIYFQQDYSTYMQEVKEDYMAVSPGAFHINYTTGILTSYGIPALETSVRYQYIQYPFEVLASPIILRGISNENFKKKLYTQVLQDDGSYINGQPTTLGTKILVELLSAVPMYWGT